MFWGRVGAAARARAARARSAARRAPLSARSRARARARSRLDRRRAQGADGISTLRLLRAFRVFRLFKRLPSLAKIVKALEEAMPGCLNAFFILILVMAIYAILGVNLFGPKFPCAANDARRRARAAASRATR